MGGSPSRLEKAISSIAGETWAIVYAYESSRRPRGLWYDRWRYDVINDYVEAVSRLGAEPFVIDVDGFLRSEHLRAGEFDFVVNLNSGATPISNLGLVPSLAQWHGIDCFPNSADVILSGERKDLCKRVFSTWFQMPREHVAAEAADTASYIVKPKTMGNSQSVDFYKPGNAMGPSMMVEEFIRGYDVTIPVFFDIDADDYVVAPPIVYVPDVPEPDGWFLSYAQKMDRSVVIDRQVREISAGLREALVQASRFFSFQSIARFDFRWRPTDPTSPVLDQSDLWFLEINCLPTLRTDVNFLVSLKAHLDQDPPKALNLIKGGSADIRALAYLLAQARAGHDHMK